MRVCFFVWMLVLVTNVVSAQTLPVDLTIDTYNPAANDAKAIRSILITPKADGSAFFAPSGSAFSASIYAPDQYLQAGESNMNFIKTEQMLTASPVTTTNVDEKIITYQYFDGLGRPIQTVGVKGSPAYNDVVVHQAYDAFGREAKKYLPYAAFPGDGLYKATAAVDQLNFYSLTYGMFHNNVKTDGSPFSETIFEASPLNRVQQQGAPGAQWQPGIKTVHFSYLINKHGTSVQGEEVLPIWTVSAVTISNATEYVLTTAANYATGSLFINVTTDENGKQVREYVDKQGKTLVKKVQYTDGAPNTYDDTHWTITWYIYDDFDRLRFVLQPEFWTSKATYLGYANNTDKRTLLGKLAFEYRHDGRGRMVYKKVPGAAPVEMVYDPWDRLVLTRDGNQKSADKWAFTKYDALNRPIITGEYTNSSSAASHQATLNTFSVRFENAATSSVGYTTNLTYPTSVGINEVYTITYYDDYSFKTNLGLGTAYDYAGAYFSSVKGQATATRERVLGSSPIAWLTTVNYFDDRYRLVHSVADDHLGNKNKATNSYYGITNWITSSTLVHGASLLTSVTTTEYDHRGRVLNVMQTTDNTAPVIVAAHKYNELGELIEKNQHSTDGGKTFLQSTDYRYNIRGWLTHINNFQLTNDGTYNNDANDLFGMELGYNTPVPVGSEVIPAQYNGNISGIAWKTNNLEDMPEEKIYGFVYDPLNRLQHAKYARRNGGLWNADVGMFNEHNIGYDRNGNITALQRTAKINGTAQVMDNLAYTYTGLGNQLTQVDDASAYDNPQAQLGEFGFTEITAGITEYEYDDNGNLEHDLNKGIVGITYNHLNLPSLVTLEPQNGKARTMAYTYSATGAKLKKIAKWGTETIGETDYITGGIHYEKAQLAFMQTPGGRAVKNGTKWEYEYHLTDHLGNVRVAYGLLQDVADYTATMETELASAEQASFSNMAAQQRSTLYNHTQPGTEVAIPDESVELNGFLGKAIGPTKLLQVKNGERVTMEVYARSPVTVSSSNVVSTLAAAVTSAFGMTTGTEAGYTALSNQAPVTAGLIGRNTGLPKAYVCYLLFNDSYAFVQHGFHAVDVESGLNFEKLALDVTAPTDGYLYIYIANESNVNTTASAYFDDFTVVHYKSTSSMKVNQVQDYYPFGLTFNSYSRKSTFENKIKFQGQEHVGALDLGWISFRWRNHQPDIGRFFNIDPLAEKYVHNSTYAFSENKVVAHIELEGLEAWDIKYSNGSKGQVYGPWTSQQAAEQYADNQLTTSPVPNPKVVSEVKEARVHPVLKETTRPHNGVDIWTTNGPTDGAPVVAPVNGTVVAKGKSDSFGNYVNIKASKDGKIHKLNHMQDESTDNIKVNDEIRRGDDVGRIGQTGLASGPHMHYEIRGGNGYGKVYDPKVEIPELTNGLDNKSVVPTPVTINSPLLFPAPIPLTQRTHQ